ncbi:glycerophosphodiester phosphodiesterase [Roseomonas sp. CCTCC AB2023176]|uniref:glycerophosphodiester phosphodiesterase n=1 Tax=Roseomonas sp. CCTCC AB2023176 TaxID=3342640 RepID=UPI0035E339AE
MVQVISHRGGTFPWPENSLTAFRNSIALGVPWVECDVHLSADSVPFVIHDATLDRTTDATGPVRARTEAELGAVTVRGTGGEALPSFDDLVSLIAPSATGLQVEIKGNAAGTRYPGALDLVLAALDRAGIRGRAGLIAFEAPLAAEAVRAGGLDHVAWLLTDRTVQQIGPAGAVAVCHAHGIGMIETEATALDAELLAAWRAAGLRVAVWGRTTRPPSGGCSSSAWMPWRATIPPWRCGWRPEPRDTCRGAARPSLVGGR